MRRRSSHQVGKALALEQLEGRSLLSAARPPFLFTPVSDGTPLAEHIHVQLAIVIGGQTQSIPAGIGFTPQGFLPIHTHDASGLIHIESPRRRIFHLSDFFKVWEQPFTRRNLLGHKAGPSNPIAMYVDGRPSNALGSVPLRDHEAIVLVLRRG
jgi:hypothetical protein